MAVRTSQLPLGNCCPQSMPCLHRELCWPGHRLKTDSGCRGKSQEELASSAEKADLSSAARAGAWRSVTGCKFGQPSLPHAELCSFMDSACRTMKFSVINSLVKTGFVK